MVMNIEQLTALQTYLQDKLAEHDVAYDIALGELTVIVPPGNLKKVAKFLRDDKKCQFKLLMAVTAADYPDRAERFDVIYPLLSIALNQRIRIKTRVADNQTVDSLVKLYQAAGWFEREVWDMFGISFKGNPDLRRILTDYGFDGHPLRKDFPMTGFVEMRYDETERRCIYEPVTLPQDFRTFDFLSPWEGMTKVMLPGDEKAGTAQDTKPKFMPGDIK
jgi:NADH-quinone oxidoreductase subunit C